MIGNIKIDNQKTFEKNYATIVLNILHIEEKEICQAYISKINSIFKTNKQKNKKTKNNSINDSKQRKKKKDGITLQ